jgi:hypothetical protein
MGDATGTIFTGIFCWNIRSNALTLASCSTRGTHYIYLPTYRGRNLHKCRVYTPLNGARLVDSFRSTFLPHCDFLHDSVM